MLAIVTDSTCDLGPARLARLGVTQVPLHVIVEGRRWLDWEELDPEELYARMKSGAAPTTEPATTADFAAIYRRLLAVYDEILSIHISSALSETFNNAAAAARQQGAESRVHVYDSAFASAPLGEMVLIAAEMRDEGHGTTEIQSRLDQVRSSMIAQFSVGDLEYLRRGGRLTRTRATFGQMLGVRPILTFESGRIVSDRHARREKALSDVIAHLEAELLYQPVNVVIGLAGQDEARVEQLRRAVEGSGLVVQRGRVQQIGAVTGAYTGPDAFIVAAYPVLG